VPAVSVLGESRPLVGTDPPLSMLRRFRTDRLTSDWSGPASPAAQPERLAAEGVMHQAADVNAGVEGESCLT
jgi:hypothetical protein